MSEAARTAPAAAELPPLQGAQLLLLSIAIAASTFMEILDTTIVNVSVPAIAGSLGVSPSEATWTVSSYALAAAIVQPLTGWLGRRVQPGEPLLAVVPEEQLWVDANFKETQLRHLKVGQAARVVADVYGSGVTFHGRVAGVSAGTGAAFALLPAQNASGNWIKVIQRVPVRIALDPRELAEHPLRIGLSTEVNVDTATPPAAVPPPVVAGTDVYALDAAQVDAEAEAIIAANLRGAP